MIPLASVDAADYVSAVFVVYLILVLLNVLISFVPRMPYYPRRARVIELRFFGGLSVEETAEVLKVAPITVMRDARLARAWLKRELQRQAEKRQRRRGITQSVWTEAAARVADRKLYNITQGDSGCSHGSSGKYPPARIRVGRSFRFGITRGQRRQRD